LLYPHLLRSRDQTRPAPTQLDSEDPTFNPGDRSLEVSGGFRNCAQRSRVWTNSSSGPPVTSGSTHTASPPRVAPAREKQGRNWARTGAAHASAVTSPRA